MLWKKEHGCSTASWWPTPDADEDGHGGEDGNDNGDEVDGEDDVDGNDAGDDDVG